VPIDRAATLKNAEKLLRQGKLDAAIAEYLRVVEDQPADWNTANLLGDLYARAGQADRAVEQFTRIADHLNEEGFLPKAAALYKKILKIKPDYEHALIQSAEIAASQGILAEARNYFNAVLERRAARGDQRGVAQIRIRLGTLDPGDYESRANAARARAQINDPAGAVRDLKDLASELADKGRQDDAIAVLREAATFGPDDGEVRERLLAAYIATGDFGKARECASTADEFKALAAVLEEQGRADEALQALRDAARVAPDDNELKAHLARAFVARGDMATAAEYLTLETAGDDPQLLMTVAEIQIRGGQVDDGLALLRRLVAEDPGRRDGVAMIGWNLAESSPDVGFSVAEVAAESAIAQSDYASAATVLQEFVTRVPYHVPALLRLIDLCVDGGLEATMYAAQAQLADAYIAAGAASEARVIAEDLVAREPWERSNVERFRKALELLGEPDPDAVIADRLSGQSPFMSTDFGSLVEDLPSVDERPAEAPPAPVEETPPAALASESPAPAAEPPALVEEAPPAQAKAPAAGPSLPPPPPSPGPKNPLQQRSEHFELSSNAIDLESILGEFETKPKPAPAPAAPSAPPAEARPTVAENVEVDLSIVLNDIKKAAATASVSAPQRNAPAPVQADSLDGVFEHLRGEAARKSALDAAEEDYKRGLAFRQSGLIDKSLEALKSASRAPKLRFQAASLLGRIYRDRGSIPEAIEWFERAAQAPAPTPEEGHQLLYELADLLETTGEVARALAICLELQADAGDFRDLPVRITRLSNVQSRG